MDHPEIARLLEALESVLEALDRQTSALRKVLDAEEEGRAIPPAVRANYRRQLLAAREQQEAMRPKLSAWGQMIGRREQA